MGLPSKKRTPRSKKERGSHFALKTTTTVKCGQCGQSTTPHQACVGCGTYKGKKVVNVEKRAARLARAKRKKT